MSKANLSKYILEKQVYTKSSLSERPARHPSLGKENNLSFQQQIAQAQRPCQNHRQRPSIFKIQTEGVPLFYCERCAILLASQGFSVEKIGAKQDHDKRDEGHQTQTIQILETRKEYLRKEIGKVEGYYGRIIGNLGVYFEGIIETVIKKREQFEQFIKKEEEIATQQYKKELVKIQKVFNEFSKCRVPTTPHSYKTLNSNVNVNYRHSKSLEHLFKEMKVLSAEAKIRGMDGIVVKDIVTIDVNSIIEMINDSLKIKTNEDKQEWTQQEHNQSFMNRNQNENNLNELECDYQGYDS